MAPSKNLIKFFFDINSPYAYIGFELLARLHTRHSSALAVQWTPVRIPAIFKKINTGPPLVSIPEKTIHLARDLRHQSEYYGIQMRVPEVTQLPAFLKAGNTVAAQRLIVAAGSEEGVELPPLIHAFYTRMWRDHLPIHEDVQLQEVLSSLHIDASTASSLIARSKTAEVKQRFVDNTQEAIDDGAFGLPWMKVYRANETTHESFFGSDRFHLIEKHLGL